MSIDAVIAKACELIPALAEIKEVGETRDQSGWNQLFGQRQASWPTVDLDSRTDEFRRSTELVRGAFAGFEARLGDLERSSAAR